MPELPEMRALAERLDAMLGGGAPLQRAEPIHFSALKTVSPDPATLRGVPVEQVRSRGKFLLIDFGGPRIALHLSQGGRVDIEDPPKATRPKFGVVRFRFDGAPSILIKEFGTERKAGWWVLEAGDDGPMASLGPEPFDEAFATLIRSGQDKRRLHTLLRDQRTVAGIGRGYADDILHRARLSPFASLTSLGAQTREVLLSSIREVMTEGLAAERKRAGGLPAKIGDHWIVHGRFGEPCPQCGARLERVSYESREVAYCPDCQTGGKVLADRRMSRLLK
ncbi:MAG TPA: DNA-formamidopyrimidine glycosylase family protein [Actinomycetota bacterium]